jgi:hypothetical protein
MSRHRKRYREDGVVSKEPAPPPPMQGDAAKPPDQWPEDWHNPERLLSSGDIKNERTPGDMFIDGVLTATR